MNGKRSLISGFLRRLKTVARRRQGGRTLQDAVLRTLEGVEAETASGATIAGITLVAGAVIVSACLPLLVLSQDSVARVLTGTFIFHAEVFEVLLVPSLAATLLLPRRKTHDSGWLLVLASPLLLAAGDGSWWLDGGARVAVITCASVAAAGIAAGIIRRERRARCLADDTL